MEHLSHWHRETFNPGCCVDAEGPFHAWRAIQLREAWMQGAEMSFRCCKVLSCVRSSDIPFTYIIIWTVTQLHKAAINTFTLDAGKLKLRRLHKFAYSQIATKWKKFLSDYKTSLKLSSWCRRVPLWIPTLFENFKYTPTVYNLQGNTAETTEDWKIHETRLWMPHGTYIHIYAWVNVCVH